MDAKCQGYQSDTDNKAPELLSLFCGPGGLDLGFEESGFVTRLAYDINSVCVETYNKNRQGHDIAQMGDLATLKPEEIMEHWRTRSANMPAGIIGGPPCQSFSKSNVHQDDSDKRHKLPEYYAAILKGVNAVSAVDFFVFENVPGLTHKKHSQKFEGFLKQFREAGFTVSYDILDAQHYGVAQKRPRVFVVGLNRAKFGDLTFKFPEKITSTAETVEKAIAGLPDPVIFDRSRPEVRSEYHENHTCMAPRSKRFSNGTLRAGDLTGRSFRVLHWDEPSYTVAYGNREVHIHPSTTRRLSVYEAMCLQGFPKRYTLTGNLSDQIRLVSEAVSPPVAKAVAMELMKQLYPTQAEVST